jgi:GT2 family glycosyltransferase
MTTSSLDTLAAVPETPRVFVVIAVHNRLDFTLACLASLVEQTHGDLKLIVVDDGSTDGSAAIISTRYPDVQVLNGDGSLWWAGATNRGVSWALERAADADFVLTMNNDTEVSPGYVESLIAAARRFPNALIGSLSVDITDPNRPLYWGTRTDWKTAKARRDTPPQAPFVDSVTPDCKNVDVLPGRGTLIPLRVFRTAGMFDAVRLPQYGADYEFAVRAHRAGYSLLVNRASVVRTHGEATGAGSKLKKLSVRAFAATYFSIRSPSCLRYQWTFARLCLPLPAAIRFFLTSSARLILGGVRDQVAFRVRF